MHPDTEEPFKIGNLEESFHGPFPIDGFFSEFSSGEYI